MAVHYHAYEASPSDVPAGTSKFQQDASPLPVPVFSTTLHTATTQSCLMWKIPSTWLPHPFYPLQLRSVKQLPDGLFRLKEGRFQ